MPVIMTRPISDITFKRGVRDQQEDDDAGDAGWYRQQNDERIDERRELRHQDEIDEDDGQQQAQCRSSGTTAAWIPPSRASRRGHLAEVWFA